MSNKHIIEYITIRAAIFCSGDDGIGDCDPEEEWSEHDLKLAQAFFDSITK